MPRTIQADGRTITVPDDATPEEINQIVGPAPVAAPNAPQANGGGVGRFLSSAAAPIVDAAKGLATAVATPPQGPTEQVVNALAPGALALKRAVVDPAIDQGKQAMDQNKSGPERVGHGLAALLPGVGPWAAQVGETEGKQLGAGDYAGAAGTAAGNAALALAPKALGKLRSLSPESKVNKLAFASGADTADLAKKTLPNVEKAAAKTGARSTVGDYLTNIDTAKNDLNTEYANALGPNANAQTMPSAISQRILALETPNMAKTAAGRAQIKVIRAAATEFQQPWTLGELDAERMEANSRLGPYEKQGIADQYSTLKKSRSVAIDKAIADGVRETVYPQMDRLAGKPAGYFASLKQQIGDLLQLQSKVDKQVKTLRDKTACIKGAPALKKAEAAEGAGSVATGYKHGVFRTLARAVAPENPEKTANKRVAKALRINHDPTLDLPIAALAGEQQGDSQNQ